MPRVPPQFINNIAFIWTTDVRFVEQRCKIEIYINVYSLHVQGNIKVHVCVDGIPSTSGDSVTYLDKIRKS